MPVPTTSPVGKRRAGFTLVEALVIAVVIAVLLAVLIPVMQAREQARLQVLADHEPWEVFEFRATPAKELYAENDDLVIECEIENLTHYPLALPSDLSSFHIAFGDNTSFVGSVPTTKNPQVSLYQIPKTAIAPGQSISFDVRFLPIGVGAAEVRLLYGKGISMFIINNGSVSVAYSFDEGGSQRQLVVMSTRGGPLSVSEAVNLIESPRGPLPRDEKHFQSNTFQLLVEAGGDTKLSTFDELIEEWEQWE